MKLLFARHGISEANLLNEFSNRGLRHGLTETGREQASALAHKLTNELILAIYSSPLLRAVETSRILSDALGLSFQTTNALIEYDVGIYEGRSDEEGWRRYTEVVNEWMVNGNYHACMEGGESLNDIRARFLPFVKELVDLYRDQDGAVLLVGHGGTYRCMLPLLLDNVSFAFSLANTIGNTQYVAAELRDGKLVCTSWCGATSFE